MRKIIISVTTVAAMIACSANVAAREASGSTNISLIVPEVCQISADEFTLTETGQITGQVQEFCNTSTGFNIIATYRPLDIGETASVAYGNSTTVLDGSGLSRVASRSGQRLARVAVTINAQDIFRPLSVAFAVTAI